MPYDERTGREYARFQPHRSDVSTLSTDPATLFTVMLAA